MEANPETGTPGRKGVTQEELEAVERLQVRCRVRYFTDGAVLGSAAYIEEIFQANRGNFGAKRKTGARKMRGAKWRDLCVARDLRKEVMTV